MREIKFRAWIPYRREMLYKGSRMDLWSYSWLYNGGLARVTPMQYTGLKDKNGKEIYEGDIVTGHPHCIEPVVVYWDEGQCGWEVREVMDKLYAHFIDWSGEGDLGYQPLEVIGNIYENPELLEVKDVRDKG